MTSEFEDKLNRVLPAALPHRELVVEKAGHHLALIVEANRHFNLTRIVSPADAAIKHVLDSVIPWQLLAKARHVLDAGTGAGFPGIPLSLALPDTRFTLAESIQKKARFVELARIELALPNVTVAARRAEDLFRTGRFDVVIARALAPVARALELLGPALKTGAKVLLYKGPDADREIKEAAEAARKVHARMEIVMRYELPDSLGTRTIVEIAS